MHDASISLAQQRYERARLLSPLPGREAEAESLYAEADARYVALLPLLPDAEEVPASLAGKEEDASAAAPEVKSQGEFPQLLTILN